MSDVRTPLRAVERVVQRDVGRNIGPLARCAAGGLGAAASRLAGLERGASVAIVTGFFIAGAEPPAAETDGPPGAGLLAELLADAGIAASLVTDAACAPVVGAVAEAASVPLHVADDAAGVDALAAGLRDGGVRHVVFVERAGPARTGETYDMRGRPISAMTAPLHRLADEPAWGTTGIGDGGNEIGMGAVPHALVADAIEHGDAIHCVVPCDALVVAGVSNWGAIALGAAVLVLRLPAVDLPPSLLVERHDALLAAALAGGAVDGRTGRSAPSVDGLDASEHRRVLTQLGEALEDARDGLVPISGSA